MTHQQQSFNHSWCYGSYENENKSINDSYICSGNSSAETYCNSVNEYPTQNYQQYPSQNLPDTCQSSQNSNHLLSSSWSSTYSPSSVSRSSSNERFSPSTSNESRRGRPLMSDSLQESDKAKEKRNYARKYREMIRSEKFKLKEENDQLRHLIQRFLYLHSILPQNVEIEIQRLKDEFRNMNGKSDKLKNCNIFTVS